MMMTGMPSAAAAAIFVSVPPIVPLFFVIVTRLFGGRNLFKPQAPKEQTQDA